MAMLLTTAGTTVLVPWRIQGAVGNEERVMNHSLKLLAKENVYKIKNLSREMKIAMDKFQDLVESFENCVDVSAITGSKKLNHPTLMVPPVRSKTLLRRPRKPPGCKRVHRDSTLPTRRVPEEPHRPLLEKRVAFTRDDKKRLGK